MNVSPTPVLKGPSDVWCQDILSFCTEAVESAPGADGFCWYEQDSGDEVADEVLAWASMEEAGWLEPQECCANGPPLLCG
jgi:hypothetical protein